VYKHVLLPSPGGGGGGGRGEGEGRGGGVERCVRAHVEK